MLRLFFLAVALIGCVWLFGCDFPEIKRPPATGVGGLDPDIGSSVSGGGAGNTDSPAAQPPAANLPAAPTDYRTVASVGDSGFQKGQYGKTSILEYNITSFFRTNERINLLMIENNMKLYKAGHDNQVPKTYEEYKREILQGINLPELKDDCRYEYDPETGDLYIVHPANMRP